MPLKRRKKTNPLTSSTASRRASRTASPTEDRATDYARRVITGEIVAGKLVRLACQRHLTDLERGPDRGLIWKPELVERIYKFFGRYLRIPVDGREPQPFILRPWQCFVQGSIFAWLRHDGFRRFRTAYIEIGKGNGKTPMAAGTGLYGLRADGEYGAEIYAAAPTAKQAKYIFEHALAMVDNSPALRGDIERFAATLVYRKAHSKFGFVSSEKRGLDGPLPHMALVDEIHEHPNATVVNKMAAGAKGRRQPLSYEITNSGYDQHTVCFDHHELSRQVLEGALDNDSWFAYVAGIDQPVLDAAGKVIKPGDDWKRDESCWPKANPNLGVSVTTEYLRKQVRQAIQIPAEENIVARLNFCVWTEGSTRAIVMEQWHACKREFDRESLTGRICYGGLDLSRTTDLTAKVLVFPEVNSKGQDTYKLLATFWLPHDRVDLLSDRDRVPYRLWAEQGFLALTPGNVVDYDFVRKSIEDDRAKFRIQEMGYDRWNATETASKLEAAGVKMVEMAQGHKTLGEPTKKLLDLIIDGRLEHNANPILTWNASNLVLRQDPNGNLAPDKEKSTKKIDGMVAGIMALGRAILQTRKPSVYEGRGVITL